MKKYWFLVIAVGFTSCLEKYDFNVLNLNEGLVVEGSISNISFDASKSFPSNGRYFKVELSKTSDVTNQRDEKVNGAVVKIKTSQGQEFVYTDSGLGDGFYYLNEDLFEANANAEYQLEILLEDGQLIESDWEALPAGENEIGDFEYSEAIRENYVFEAGEKVIGTEKGLKVSLNVPNDNLDANQLVKWSFDPLWTFTAAMVPSDSPIRKCWVSSDQYLKNVVLGKFKKGGFEQELFFMETAGNWRLYDYFSVLVHQEKLSPGYYQFWKDLEAQGDKGGLFDQPPFGLNTNFTNTNGPWTVNGYFGVVNESTVRWTFNPKELSYVIEDDLYDFCLENGQNDPRLPPGQCYDCRAHTLGTAENTAPFWWEG
ncbi:DUF4249 family protein [Arcticibacterium luteifluviistationis]|uniref:DUF4249 domain-containing protein n=1 Tax=Arcticibacterium luteifluviistationis TaxID=1784714 RepID=A0A2Z4GCE3_9BACT|nr:DUF4249 family protein [Arcticibacterium luteifluviistationis]AWV98760.1 hypothetical protein DJ013_11480 [Arcticibacterium luteifluviistationis]